jgi:hypothetical protein
MQEINRRAFIGSLTAVSLAAAAGEGWVELFDGRSLNGWKPSEHQNSWQVVDGMLTANGPRSHLFYNGPVKGADFRNFELEVEVVTQPECNSGVYFHTAYQESGFPEKGFEIQVNNTARGDGGYLERKKTGSLYGLRNMYMQLVPDLKPFRYHIAVRGKNVQIRLNGQLLVDYVEPTPAVVPAGGSATITGHARPFAACACGHCRTACLRILCRRRNRWRMKRSGRLSTLAGTMCRWWIIMRFCAMG